MSAVTAQVLRDARDRISNPKAWWKSGSPVGAEEGRGSLCAFLAIANVMSVGDAEHHPATLTLARVIGGRTAEDVATYNDAPETTHADVLAAFDHAIALADVKR